MKTPGLYQAIVFAINLFHATEYSADLSVFSLLSERINQSISQNQFLGIASWQRVISQFLLQTSALESGFFPKLFYHKG